MHTVLRSTGFKLLCCVVLVFSTSLVYSQVSAQKLHASSAVTTLNSGNKWETDDAVRKGMENIHQAMTTSQQGIAKEQLSAQDYQQLADTIDKNLAAIVNTRHVSKEAETAFHLVVMMDLTQSTALMRSALKVQLQRAGAFGVQQSLRNYGQHFQHPGWTSGT